MVWIRCFDQGGATCLSELDSSACEHFDTESVAKTKFHVFSSMLVSLN